VEDDALVAAHLGQLLLEMHHEVAGVAARGEDAVALAKTEALDLVLMDIRLRGALSGIEAAAQIRQDHDLPIIFLTAHTDPEMVAQAESTQPYAYLAKPVREQELRASVRMALHKSELDRRLRRLNQILRAVRSINQLVRQQKDPARLLQLACEILLQTRGYETVWIAGSASEASPSARAGRGQDFVEWRTTTAAAPGAHWLPPAARALETRQPSLIQDVATAAEAGPWREAALQRGLVAEASVPMLHAERCYGVLSVLASQPQTFDPDEVELLGDLAADLAFAVHSLRAETRRHQAEEQTRYQAMLLDQIRDTITATDLDGRVTYVNEAQCAALHRFREELIGTSVELFGDDPRQGATQREIIETTRSVGEWQGVVVNRPAGGQEYVLNLRTTLLRDATGRPLGMCGVGTDVTEHRRAELALQAAHERLTSIFEGARDAIIIADVRTGIILEANSAAARLLRRSKEELIGLHQTQVHPPDLREMSRQRFQARAQQPSPTPVEEEIWTAEGQRIPVEISASTITLADGRRAMVGLFRDITERKRAAQQTQAQLEELQRWHRTMRGQEDQLAELKREVNALCRRLGEPVPYPIP